MLRWCLMSITSVRLPEYKKFYDEASAHGTHDILVALNKLSIVKIEELYVDRLYISSEKYVWRLEVLFKD